MSLTLALIHGWGVPKSVFNPMIEELPSSQFDEIISYEMPGYGSRSAEPFPKTIDALADDAREHIPSGALWLGWSLGAMVGIAAAEKSAESIGGLFLVSPTVRFFDADNAVAFDALCGGVEAHPKKALKRFCLSMPSPDNRSQLRKTIGEMVKQDIAGDVLLAGLEILKSTDLSDPAARLDLPVKLIAGADDAIIPVPHSQHVGSLIRNSQLDILPAGHLPFLECPKTFVESLLEFAKTIA